MTNPDFFEDFEREAQKDSIYLLERQMRIEIEWRMWEEEQRLPAKIEVTIEKHKIAKEDEPEILPF